MKVNPIGLQLTSKQNLFPALANTSRQLTLLGCCLVVCGGCVSQPTNPPRSVAELSLIEARKSISNPQVAAGYYLDAAEAVVSCMGIASSNSASDSRSVYNSACQELTLLLNSNRDLWNWTDVIQSRRHIYRLHFTAGSHTAGIWAPDYFDFFRSPKGVHEKFRGTPVPDGWGGALIGIHKPADPSKYFLPKVGLAVPVTAVVDIPQPGATTQSVRDVNFTLYERIDERQFVWLAHQSV
jgi:hypothetical protein